MWQFYWLRDIKIRLCPNFYQNRTISFVKIKKKPTNPLCEDAKKCKNNAMTAILVWIVWEYGLSQCKTVENRITWVQGAGRAREKILIFVLSWPCIVVKVWYSSILYNSVQSRFWTYLFKKYKKNTFNGAILTKIGTYNVNFLNFMNLGHLGLLNQILTKLEEVKKSKKKLVYEDAKTLQKQQFLSK